MRVIRHPLVARDIAALVDHIVEVTDGDFAAASRRLDEIDALVSDIIANPMSGMRLATPLDGWLVRHGGRGHRITIVFRPDREADCLFIALVAWSAPSEVVHPQGYDYPIFRRTKRWLESETSRKRSC